DKVLSFWLTLSTSRRQGWRRAMNNTTKTTARCARCNRPLRSARALRTGYGPRCYTKVRAAAHEAAAQHKPHQAAKATALIEDGGVVPTARAAVDYTAGPNAAIHHTARPGCTCPVGLTGRYVCIPRMADEIAEATFQPAAYQLLRTPVALGLAA